MTRQQQQHDDDLLVTSNHLSDSLVNIRSSKTQLEPNTGRLYGMDTTTEGGHLLCIYMAHYRYYNDTPLDGEDLLTV